MLARALEANVDAVICFTTDWERAGELASLVKSSPGFLYGAYGMHPDNVKRNHDKTFAARLAELRNFALSPECVAIFTGLDLGRDIASHYPQEAALTGQLRLAAELRLPVIVQATTACERAVELIAEFSLEWSASATPSGEPSSSAAAAVAEAAAVAAPWVPRVAVFAFEGDEKELAAYATVDAYVMVSGAVCDSTEKGTALRRDIIPRIPLHRLLLASNSPLQTPQNIADHYIRSQRNEPSNMPAVLPLVCEAWNAGLPAGGAAMTYAAWSERGGAATAIAFTGTNVRPFLAPADLADVLYRNAARFFDIPLSDAASGDAAVGGGADYADDADRDGDDEGGVISAPGTAVETADAAADAAGEPGGGTPVVGAPAATTETSSSASSSSSSSSSNCSSEADSSSSHGVSGAVVQYRCRSCRTLLFSDADVMPHDGSGVRPSLRAEAVAAAVLAAPSASTTASQGTARGKGVANSNIGAAPAAAASERAAASGVDTEVAVPVTAVAAGKSSVATADSSVGEVGVSRWHTAKGRAVNKHEAVCRALLVEKMPWMTNVPATTSAPSGKSGSASSSKGSGAKGGDVSTEGEGSLLCPGCTAKVGQVRRNDVCGSSTHIPIRLRVCAPCLRVCVVFRVLDVYRRVCVMAVGVLVCCLTPSLPCCFDWCTIPSKSPFYYKQDMILTSPLTLCTSTTTSATSAAVQLGWHAVLLRHLLRASVQDPPPARGRVPGGRGGRRNARGCTGCGRTAGRARRKRRRGRRWRGGHAQKGEDEGPRGARVEGQGELQRVPQ